MAEKFVLTLQVNLQGPQSGQTRRVLNQIQSQLSGVKVDVKLNGADRAVAGMKNIKNSTDAADASVKKLGKSFLATSRRFAAFAIATRTISLLSNKLGAATEEAIKFQREMNKIRQVTGQTVGQLKFLEKTITNLSVKLGVASGELVTVARVLSQAGFRARDLEVALGTLAKTALAPTFEDLTKTTEGAIAIFNQFGKGADALEGQLGAINAVAGKFAVEAGDLIGVVRRAGGVFKAAGGDLNELIALFTAVRSTTRESAESISTGLRTIFTRIQRPKTLEFLKKYNIELTKMGKFVGPFEAVRRLSKAFQELEEGDVRITEIGEELAGFRQIGKVIPLLQQFAVAEEARQVALAGGQSLTRDAATAQESLAVQIAKVREEWTALVRSFADTGTFKVLVGTTLELASALAKVLESLKPLLPAITAFAGVKLGGVALGALGIGRRKNFGGPVGLARGGVVPGTGNRDSVPAMLTPGEFVIKKSSVGKIGAGNLAAMNGYAGGGQVMTVTRKKRSLEKAYPTIKKLRLDPKKNYSIKLERQSYNKDSNEGRQILANMIKRKRQNPDGKFNWPHFEEAISDIIKIPAAKGNSPLDYPPDPGEAKFMKWGAKYKTDGDKGNLPQTYLAKALLDPATQSQVLRAATTGPGRKGGRKGKSQRGGLKSPPKVNAYYPDNGKQWSGIIRSHVSGKQADETQYGGVALASGGAVPAMLTPGEFVFNKQAASSIGSTNLNRMNKHGVTGFNRGGGVGGAGLAIGLGASALAGTAFGGDETSEVMSTLTAAITAATIQYSIMNDALGDNTKEVKENTEEDKKKPDKKDKDKKKLNIKIDTKPLNKVANKLTTVSRLLKTAAKTLGKSAGSLETAAASSRAKDAKRSGKGMDVAAMGQDKSARRAAAKKADARRKKEAERFNQPHKVAPISQLGMMRAGIGAAGMGPVKKTPDISAEDLARTGRGAVSPAARQVAAAGGVEKATADEEAIRKAKRREDDKAAARDKRLQEFRSIDRRNDRRGRTRASIGTLQEIQKGGASKKELLASARFERRQFRKSTGASPEELKRFDAALAQNVKGLKVKTEVTKKDTAAQKAAIASTKRLSIAQVPPTTNLKKLGFAARQASKKLRSMSGKALAGLGAGLSAASVAANYFANQAQKAADAAIEEGDIAGTKQAVGGATFMRNLGGIAAGAAGGALAGSMFGPWGTLIGAVGGGALAFLNMSDGTKEMDEAMRKLADNSIAKASKFLNEFAAGEGSLQQFSSDFASSLSTTRRALQETSKGITAEDRKKELALQKAAAVQIGLRAKSEGELNAALAQINVAGGQVPSSLKRLAQSSFDAAKAQEALVKVNLDSIEVMSGFARAQTAVDNLIAGFETGSSQIALSLNTFKTASTTVGGAAKGNEAITNIMEELTPALAGTSVGGAVQRSAESARSANTFMSTLQGELRDLTDIQVDDPAAARALVEDRINALAADAQDPRVAQLVQGALGKALDQVDFTGDVADLSPIVEAMRTGVIDPLSKDFIVAAEAMAKHEQDMNKVIQQRINSELKLVDVQRKAIDVQIEAEKNIAKFGGGQFTPGREADLRRQQFNISAQNAGIGGLQGNSVAEIRRAGNQIRSNFGGQELEARSRGVSGAGGLKLDADKRKDLVKLNETLLQHTRRLIKTKEEELAIAKKQNELSRSSLDSLLEGDFEGFFSGQAASAAASTLRTGGDISQFSQSDLNTALKSLRGQVSAQELARISAPVFARMGLGGSAAQSFADATPEQQGIQQEIVAASQAMIELANNAADMQRMDVRTKEVIIAQADRVFFENLNAQMGNPAAPQNNNVPAAAAGGGGAAGGAGRGGGAGAGGGSGDVLQAERRNIEDLNRVADKLNNTTITLLVPEPITVDVKGVDIKNIQDSLRPFVVDVIKTSLRSVRITESGPNGMGPGLDTSKIPTGGSADT